MLSKAVITNLTTNDQVICMFNPTEYTFTKSNSWNERIIRGTNVSRMTFEGGEPASLSMKLLFDTYESHELGQLTVTAGQDVRQYTRNLWEMMKVSEQTANATTGKGEPPQVRFEWGSYWSFKAVITQISQNFTLFGSDGTPLRATLDVSFKQISDEGQYPRQNPSSGGRSREHVRTVREYDTLERIAFEEYGDPTVWRHIALANDIQNPRRLRAGQKLIITPLPTS